MTAPIVHGWVVAASASAGIALMQYFGQAGSIDAVASFANAGEAYGNLRQRNQFATLTSFGLAAALWACGRWPQAALAGFVALLAFANAASASRTGVMQWIAIAIAAVCWRRSLGVGSVRLAGFALAAYIAAALTLPLLLYSVTGQEAPNVFSRMASSAGCNSRVVLWMNVLELSAVKPWSGWGWGELDFAHYAHAYAGERFCDILDNAHNLPLHLAVELGWPTAALLCGLAAWAIWRGKPWRETSSDRQVAWLVVLAIALHSLVEYPLWYGPFQVAFGLACGLLARAPSSIPLVGKRPIFVPALATALIAYAAWDYHRISQLYMPPELRSARFQERTLEKAQASWLFRDQVRFAELVITPLTRVNAGKMHALALDALHFSPEPRVLTTLIDAALLLGREDEAAWHIRRFKAAFPDDYREWAAAKGLPPTAP